MTSFISCKENRKSLSCYMREISFHLNFAFVFITEENCELKI